MSIILQLSMKVEDETMYNIPNIDLSRNISMIYCIYKQSDSLFLTTITQITHPSDINITDP